MSPVKPDPGEPEDPLVHPVSRENGVDREETEKEEPQVHPVRKVNLEPKVCLVFPVTRENEDTKDLRASKVPVALLELLVTMVHLDYLESPEKWVLGDSLEIEALQVCLDHLVFLELKEVKVLKAMKDPLDHPDLLAKPEIKDQLDRPVRLDH